MGMTQNTNIARITAAIANINSMLIANEHAINAWITRAHEAIGDVKDDTSQWKLTDVDAMNAIERGANGINNLFSKIASSIRTLQNDRTELIKESMSYENRIYSA